MLMSELYNFVIKFTLNQSVFKLMEGEKDKFLVTDIKIKQFRLSF